MMKKLCIFICENYKTELQTVLKSEGFEDVEYEILPAGCGRPPLNFDDLINRKGIFSTECRSVCLLGGICIKHAENFSHNSPDIMLEIMDNCFYLFLNQTLLNDLIQKGNYLISPGWLASWKSRMDEWGFNMETARKFFREFTDRLLLLDTGIDPEAEKNLIDFADFLDLPYKIFPAGLDIFTLILQKTVQKWKYETKISSIKAELADSNRKLADYAMMYNMLSRISAIESEAEVIKSILELFMILCAPSQILYLPVFNDDCQEIECTGIPADKPEQEAEKMFCLNSEYAWTDKENGFYLKINYLDETVGVLKIEGFAFPQYKEHYLNIAHSIKKVCGLAIDNSRKYNRLKQAKEEISKARKAADIANQAKSEFLANMSHELRTPLNGILGYAQILKMDQSLKENQRAGVDVVERSGKHLLNLINEILDLSKIEARKMEIYNSSFSFSEFIDSIIKIIEVQAAKKGILFHPEIYPDIPKSVCADEKRLGQILLNLLGNAVKFTDKGMVGFNVKKVDSGIYFEISDTGVGIAQDQIKDIFSPFKQVGEYSRTVEGTGLGLTISHKLVKMMGGELNVKSTLGKGSVFCFSIELPEISEPELIQQSEKHYISGYKGKRRKILIIDDRWENRSVMSSLLSPLGFEVAIASDGSEGLHKTSEFQPDLIFIDLVMPIMDGFEATRRIRNSPLKHIKIIAISASTSLSPKEIIAKSNFDDFILKPVQIEDVFKAIEMYLGVEWIYGKKINNEESLEHESACAQEISLPDLSEIESLYNMARGGDIMGIRKKLDEIEDSDKQYISFVKEVRKLARTFQIKEIRNLMKKYMKED